MVVEFGRVCDVPDDRSTVVEELARFLHAAEHPSILLQLQADLSA
jgi:hypothetical protein